MPILDTLKSLLSPFMPGQALPTPPPAVPPKAPDAPMKLPLDMSGFAQFQHLMEAREGVRYVVYEDSLGKPTVGIGHLVLPRDSLKVGDKVTPQQVAAFFALDGMAAWLAAGRQMAAAGISTTKAPDFQVWLASVNYQLGVVWNTKFPNTWELIVDGKYDEAADALTNTAWNKETPVRVADFQKALRALPPHV